MNQAEPLFNPQEQTDNERRKNALCKILSAGDAILMAGAGISCLTGYPTWGGLLSILENIIRDREVFQPPAVGRNFQFRMNAAIEPDLQYATRLKVAIGENRFIDKIHEIFDEEKPILDCHQQLLSIPYRAILTTNYDRLLERTLFQINHQPYNQIILNETTTNRELQKFLRGLNLHPEANNPKVVHLHGEITNRPSIILCLEDYERKYGFKLTAPNIGLYQQLQGNIPGTQAEFDTLLDSYGLKWTIHRKIIWALMATRTLFYVGFSMTDPFFQMMHKIVTDDVGQYETDSHFIALRITADTKVQSQTFARQIKVDYGIETIFFEDDEHYNGLARFIDEISRRCDAHDQTEQPVAVPMPENGSPVVTQELLELSKGQNINGD